MPYADKSLICRDCASGFVFSVGEQSFYAARGLVNEPSRCPACRNARKNGGAPGETYIYHGPAASFGGRAARQMHPATCDRCGQMTEVPFLPKDDRPVFCPECFAASRREPSRASTSRG